MDFVGSILRVWSDNRWVLVVHFWPAVATKKENETTIRVILGFRHTNVKLSNS